MSPRIWIACVMSGLGLFGCASAPPSGKVVFVPADRAGWYDEEHFAPALRTGNTIIISGVAAAGTGTYEEKVRRMFERVKAELAQAGADMSDVVEIDTFHTQPKDTQAFDDEFDRFLKIHDEYFPAGNYPAWTAIGGIVLLAPGAVVEMRVVAVIGAGKSLRVNHGDSKQTAPPT
jgi:enamine deaminase RidA (YjgF/YER057c/UK114 family)